MVKIYKIIFIHNKDVQGNGEKFWASQKKSSARDF